MFIATRWKTPAALIIALSAVLTIALGLMAAGYDRPTALDRVVDPLAQSTLENPLFDRTDVYFQQLGDVSHLAVLVAGVVLVLLVLRQWPAAVLVVVSTGVAIVATKFVLKPLVDRHYYDGVLSFPSTHVASVASVMLAIAVTVLSAGRPGLPLRLLAAVLAVAVALTSAVAVVAEQTHYTTDAVAGWSVATAVVLGVALAIDRIVERSRPEPAEL